MQEVEGRKLEPHLAYQLHFPLLLLFLSFPSITHHHCVWELSVVSRYRPPPALFIIFSLSEHIISCCSFRKQRQSSELLFQRHTRIHSRNRNYRSFSILLSQSIFIPPGYTELRRTFALGVGGTTGYLLCNKLTDMY